MENNKYYTVSEIFETYKEMDDWLGHYEGSYVKKSFSRFNQYYIVTLVVERGES